MYIIQYLKHGDITEGILDMLYKKNKSLIEENKSLLEDIGYEDMKEDIIKLVTEQDISFIKNLTHEDMDEEILYILIEKIKSILEQNDFLLKENYLLLEESE